MAKYSSAIIGHVSLDTNTDHLGNSIQVVGGAVICSAASAYALGHNIVAVTKVAEEHKDRLNGFTIPKENVICLPSKKSTEIQNVYHTADKERRTCTCVSQGDAFKISEMPDIEAEIFHLAGLLYGDFDAEIIRELAKKGRVAVDVQAMLRHPNGDKAMYFEDWKEKKECLPYISFLKTDAAEAEIMTGTDDRRLAAKYLYAWGAREIMITHNTEVLIYDGKEFYTCPIRARNLSGRTGRGDTTFAAYINERLNSSIPDALLMATATVSCKMETPGPFKGTRKDIDEYIKLIYPEYVK